MHLEKRIEHERLTRICFNDYNREIALVAELKSGKEDEGEIIGVGRLSKLHKMNEGEFALLVNDKWQSLGLGHELLKQLIEIGRAEKLEHLSGRILADNHAMQHICKKLGFKMSLDDDKRTYTAQFVY